MMRLLIVEDDAEFEATLRDGLDDLADLVIETVRDRDEAIRALEHGEYDFILCDLRIPSVTGRVDASVEHGLAVHAHAQQVSPGTPITIMSAYGTMDIVKHLYETAPRDDPFGVRRSDPMTTFFEKSALPELVEHVKAAAGEFRSLEAIAIHSSGVDFGLSTADRTVIRLFCRRQGGVIARLQPLRPGLSKARVIRIDVVDQYGARKSQALAKLAPHTIAADEGERFRRLVAPQLASGAFAHLIDEVKAGACRTGGLFYWFAAADGAPEGYSSALLDLLPEDEELAVRVLLGLKEKLSPWVAAAHQEECTVGDVRRWFLSDDEFPRIASGLPARVAVIEQMKIYVNKGPEHGDLHGFNVLVRTEDAAAVIIDYGSVSSAPVAVDPVTLELSCLFHPESAVRRLDWPSVEQTRRWASAVDFSDGSPIPKFVSSCREWAHERSASDGEVFAVAYAYAARQLKYADVDPLLAGAIAEAATVALDNL